MNDSDERGTSLDLPEAELEELFAGVERLAEQELSIARSGPVFESPPSATSLQTLLADEQRLPLEGEPIGALLGRCAAILSAGRRTAPTFFGYILSPAAPVGVAADLLASAANQNLTSWRSAPAATALELITIRWLGQLVGFADDAAGLLVSGGSAANLTALWMALRSRGDDDLDRRTLVAYASEAAHFSVLKAAGVLGVGLQAVGTGSRRELDPAALKSLIEADRAAGRRPFCVVATAGSTATGAIDPLAEIAAIAAEQRLWLHVDGAYGAPAAAVPAERHLFAGIELADSLCIDAHKWLYAPLDCGALLVRPSSAPGPLEERDESDYVRVIADRDEEEFAFWQHGLELSRRFRALKLWMILRYHGAAQLAAAIAEDIELARYMAERVRQADELELLTEPSLSICCFRHSPPGAPAGLDLNAHNERLLKELQREGAVYLSNATLDGRLALRACITNFRSTRRDVERTLELVRCVGTQLLESPHTAVHC